MTPRDGFLHAIREAPDDPTPRLVFSDWLEDRSFVILRGNDYWAGPDGGIHSS